MNFSSQKRGFFNIGSTNLSGSPATNPASENSHDCLVDNPVCTGKLEECICLAEASTDAAHLNSHLVLQDISTLCPDGCTTDEVAALPGKACSICPAEVVDDPTPPESSYRCTSSCDGSSTSQSIGDQETGHKLSFFYQNVRGLRTKIDAFFLAVTACHYDVIILTETWLDAQILSPQLFGNSYTVFRNDRNQQNSRKARGGGVLIAISSRIRCCGEPSPVHESLEQIWVKLKLPRFSISVGVVYLPPDRKADMFSIKNHVESIESVFSNLGSHDHAFLFGDYNQSDLVWNTTSTSPTLDVIRSSVSKACSNLLDGFCLNRLTQINHILNRNGRLLDLVLVNESALGNCILSEAVEPLSALDSDHPALELEACLPDPIEFDDAPCAYGFDFRKADFDGLNEALLRYDWQFLETVDSIDDAVNSFTRVIEAALLDYVPLRRPPPKPLWGNSRLKHLKRRRSKALRKYSRNRCLFTKQELVRASNRYRLYNRLLYKRYTLRMQDSLRRNPKQFWNFVKSKRNENGLPTEMFLGDCYTSSSLEKCNLFARHFLSAFNDTTSTDSQVEIACRGTTLNVCDLAINNITVQQVSSAIKKMKYSTAASPDCIPSCVLKECCVALSPVLAVLFNISLQQRKFPESWKLSVMFPVHKKGDKRNIENYRGITSLCASSKVFEIVVYDMMFSAFKTYISTDQHGFYPKRSVSTNLVQFVSHCLRTMDSGFQTDVIYTDFKSAFDRVDHNILLKRLELLGICSNSICWLKSYLKDRKLCVTIGSETSATFTNLSGVPQGSNLGPLLFSIFINDLSRLLPPGCKLFFADDVKIYMIIQSLSDCAKLQQLVDHFADWSLKNMLTLSIHKCNTITFHRKQNPICYDYAINNIKLERVNHVRDLGIILDSALTFRIHFDDIISRGNRQLGFIFKICDEFKDPFCLRSLYCALVRSILESNAVVWCPYQSTWISRIEAIQRKFVRRTLRHLPWRDPLNLPSYEDRCCLLGLDTLVKRRFVQQAGFAAKVLKGELDAPEILSSLNIYAPERVLRQRDFLMVESSNTLYAENGPISAITSAFNEVYEIFDFNMSTASFIRKLQQRNPNNHP